jgi:hypothetical protein
MTPEKLVTLMDRHGMTREDLAHIAGRTTRQTYGWTTGQSSIPQVLAILLRALDEGKVDPGWLLRAVRLEARKT